MLHVCRTPEQFSAIGLRCAEIIEVEWQEVRLLKWFKDVVLGVHKSFSFNATGVPGVLACNNCTEAWNMKTKSIWVPGMFSTTAQVVATAMTQLVHGDGEELGGNVPFTRQPLKRMPRHIKTAKMLLENTELYVLQSEEDRTVLFVDSSYEESIGRRQRGRSKRRVRTYVLS
eukprot:GHVU01072173.1.p1 GENE.GHVU01072173.1~~GHVU01072173.1.p1  ORF type:complete len:172 (-),score=16.44 GHVU01072173.1:1161-1676(-)